jgi:DNA invertase Pin-like site-specific DNA recombinase
LPKSSWSIGRSGNEVAKRKGIYKGRQKGTTKADPTRARELWDKGLTTAEIAQALATNKRTVQRYLKADALAKNSRVFLK